MPQIESSKTGELPTVRISRVYPTSRATLFAAWSSADHVKRWFCPSGYTAPDAVVEMRVGGRFEVCMRASDGTIHWVRGVFTEASPIDRLAFDALIEDAQGNALFRARTEATFSDARDGARLDVSQTYEVVAPEAAWMPRGAPQGWQQTLDKLESEVLRIAQERAARSAAHSAFEIQRVYEAPLARVFKAFSDEVTKSQWFAGAPEKWRLLERKMDFRIGGRELLRGRWENGTVTTFEAVYHDIVDNARIVYSYAMHMNDKKISVSLATLLFESLSASRTKLVVVEQGAFLDGYDDAGSREQGSGVLLDRIGEIFTAA